MTQTRRRGADLQAAIFTATLEILENEGYEAISFQSVAAKAHTSRSVLYRAWDSPLQLAYEATRSRMIGKGKDPSLAAIKLDTGSLRGDLLALTNYFATGMRLFPKYLWSGILTQIACGSKDFQTLDAIPFNNLAMIKPVIERAITRGELVQEPSQTAQLMIFQTLRYEMIFAPDKLDDKCLTELVDDIFLPIFKKSNN